MGDGYLNFCKECVRTRVKTHRDNNLERIREYDRKRGYRPSGKQQTEKARKRAIEHRVAWSHRNPLKRLAHKLVRNAVVRGELRRLPCERCGAEPAHAHHDDYSKALSVMWLCPIHHGERHRELNEQARKQRKETKTKEPS